MARGYTYNWRNALGRSADSQAPRNSTNLYNPIVGADSTGINWNWENPNQSRTQARGWNPNSVSGNIYNYSPDRGMMQTIMDADPEQAWSTYANNFLDYATSKNHGGVMPLEGTTNTFGNGIENTGSYVNPYAKQSTQASMQDALMGYYLKAYGSQDIGNFDAASYVANPENMMNYQKNLLASGAQGAEKFGSIENPFYGQSGDMLPWNNIAGTGYFSPEAKRNVFTAMLGNLNKAASSTDTNSGFGYADADANASAEMQMQALAESPEMVQRMMSYALGGRGGMLAKAYDNQLNKAWQNYSLQGMSGAAPYAGGGVTNGVNGQPVNASGASNSDFTNFLNTLWGSLGRDRAPRPAV